MLKKCRAHTRGTTTNLYFQGSNLGLGKPPLALPQPLMSLVSFHVSSCLVSLCLVTHALLFCELVLYTFVLTAYVLAPYYIIIIYLMH